MSSLTISTIVCFDSHPCSSIVGLNARTRASPRCTLAGEVPVGERRAIQVGGQSFLQVLGIYLLVVACDKVLQRRAKVRSDAGRDELGDLLLPLSARFLGDIGHGTPSTYFFGDTAMPTASV